VIPETVVKTDLFLVLGTGFTAATTKRFDRLHVFTTSRLRDFTTSGAQFRRTLTPLSRWVAGPIETSLDCRILPLLSDSDFKSPPNKWGQPF